ncbi:MAG: hypothetical protein EOO77_40180 [Oxalobacteraceae bacterium]|nr:MAG: hypothetical protein EOO77_40180 [Oxalobacteraceae bacterium]
MTAPQRPIAAAYEAQPVIEAMILALHRDRFDDAVLSVDEVRSLLNDHFAARPSKHAVAEAFDEGSRLGAWTLIGRPSEPNHIEVKAITIGLFADALGSQSDSTLYALNKVGTGQLASKLANARQQARHDSGEDVDIDKISISLKRLEHNHVFQRGFAATKSPLPAQLHTSIKGPSKSNIDWTKSSAIAAWIAIPLAAIGAIAAIIAIGK